MELAYLNPFILKKTKSILESTEFKNKYYKGKVKTNRTIISNNNLNYNYNTCGSSPSKIKGMVRLISFVFAPVKL